MKTVQVGDLFTEDEIAQATVLWWHVEDHRFARLCATLIVEPILPRINAKTGQENDALYLAYMLQCVIMGAVQ